MTTEEKLTEIVVKEQKSDIIPFFKSLTAEEKHHLIPKVKALSIEYFEYIEVKEGNGNSIFKMKATEIQHDIIGLAAFLCLNIKDFERGFFRIFNKNEISPILEWYCPSWFNEYVNKLAAIDYDWVMELSEKGYINPSKELIVKLIPQMIFEYGKDSCVYVPENLIKREITLKEHIWYIFEYETDIHWSDRYMIFNDMSKSIEHNWSTTLKKLSDEGKIERSRLLKESLLATSKNFNKTLSGWFADLFNNLDPSPEELLKLQNELFTIFDSVNSKPVNTSLKFIKKIVHEKAFMVDRFLEKTSLLLTSDTKSIVTSTISMLDIIAKNHKEKQAISCEMACQAFIHHDEDIQSKTAKLINKYGSKSVSTIQNAFSPYLNSLFSQAKDLLQEFIIEDKDKPIETTNSIESYNLQSTIGDENKIESIENFDEFLFLASQAFDGNEPYHFDLLPASIIAMQSEIKGDNIAKLEPAFQRAYKLATNNWQSSMGNLDQLLATFFIDYGRILISMYPEDTASIKKIHDTYVKKQIIGKWENNNPIYQPFVQLLNIALKKIKSQSTLPLLSTPTHSPCWISPDILIDRLSQYQEAQTIPDELDFQIAISRCFLESTEKTLELIDKKLTGEYADLVQYLLEECNAPTTVTLPSIWAIVCLTKRKIEDFKSFAGFPYTHLNPDYLTGQFKWKTKIKSELVERYDYEKRANIKEPFITKSLRIEYRDKLEKQSYVNNILSKSPVSNIEIPLIYDFLEIRQSYFYNEHNDIVRWIFLTPNNPEPILSQIITRCLNSPHLEDESQKKIVANTLSTILDIWKDFGEMAHLFVAACLISSDKTIRDFASEIWIRGVQQQNINSRLIGEIIGILERIEFAPIKRLTDLILSNMFQLSEQHNTELEKLLAGCIENLPMEPISNLKKLLEIYVEITTINGTKNVNEKIMAQVQLWESSDNLKKVIKVLKNN